MTGQVAFQRHPARESTGDKVGAHFQADCKVLPLFDFGGAKSLLEGQCSAVATGRQH